MSDGECPDSEYPDGEFSNFFPNWSDSQGMADAEQLVGVVGSPPTAVVDGITHAGTSLREGDAESVLADEPDFVLAYGEASFLDVARTGPDVPILPVDAGRGVWSVPASRAVDAVRHVLAGEGQTQSIPVLAIELDGEQVGRAVADVALLTAEVAHISEYAVRSGDDLVDQFRADGVVVATPVGSPGYARRLGCPVVAPGTGVLIVAPIAPFATDPDHWVLPRDDLVLSVERDETTVSLLADDAESATVSRGEQIRILPGGTATVAIVSESGARFE